MTSLVMDISPFQFLADADGEPLDEGYVWIGQINKDPRQFPATAYYDLANTIPAAMPLRTTNGYVVRNNAPTYLFVNGNYSVLVEDKNHRQIYYVADFFLTGTNSAVALSDLANAVNPVLGAGMVGYRNRTVYARLSDFLNVKDFGASGDGVTDDTAAFNAAIAYANARGNNDSVGTVGTTIFIPDGRYKVGALGTITKSGCEFVGSSPNGAVLLCASGVGAIFNFGNGVDIVIGGGVRNVKFEYLLTPGISDALFSFKNCFRLAFCDLMLVNIGIMAQCGFSPTNTAGDITFSRIKGYKANIANALFNVINGAGLYLNSVTVFVGGVLAPIHPASMTTVPNCNVFNCIFGSWDTVMVSNCIFERFYQGLSIVAISGRVYQNFHFSNVVMDYHRSYVVYAESQLGGVIAGIRFDDNSWFVSWEADAINLNGAGYHDDHYFAGRVVIAGLAGLNYSLVNAKNITFNGMQLNSVNRLGSVNGAMVFGAAATGFTVIGCRGNVDTTGIGFPWRAPFGITVATNADNYLVEGCGFDGSTGGYSVAANASPSVNRRFGANSRANYAGQAAGMALGASTVAFFNTTPFVVACHLRQGTVSSILKGAVGINGAVDGDFMLDPGQSLTVTYTVAPSLTSLIMG